MRDQNTENLFEEIVMENFLNLLRKRHTVWEAQRIPSKRNSKRPTPKHIINKMAKG